MLVDKRKGRASADADAHAACKGAGGDEGEDDETDIWDQINAKRMTQWEEFMVKKEVCLCSSHGQQ